MNLSLFKKKEFYPMVWGVRETEIPLGMRSVALGNVYYVDYDHLLANDDNTGSDPDNPLKTIQAAIDSVDSNDSIIVRSINPAGESAIVYPWSADNVSLVGAGISRYSPVWQSDAALSPCLTVFADGWKISGFRFCAITDMNNSVWLNGAKKTTITENYFDGATVGYTGIIGSSLEDIWITNNWFSLWHTARSDSDAIYISSSERVFIVDNALMDNDANIYVEANAFILGNTVQQVGYAYTATESIDTASGSNSIVSTNILEGAYEISTYEGDASDMWVGNNSCDVTQAEVGDNGFTIANPAAAE